MELFSHILGGGGGCFLIKSLWGCACCWMGLHFHDWIDYSGVAFSIEWLEYGCTFSDFLGKKILVSRIQNDLV